MSLSHLNNETVEFNVGNEYNAQSSNGKSLFVTKGTMNKLLLRPQLLNAHTPYDSDVQSTVTSTNIVGQIFKAEKDNINGITLSLGNAQTETVIDNFEYVDDAALRAVWSYTGDAPESDTTPVSPNNGSTRSFEIDLDSAGDEYFKTITSTNFTGAIFELDFWQNVSFANAKVSLYIGDGTNTKSIQIAFQSTSTWETIELMESAMSEDGAGTTNSAAITKIGFRIDDASNGDEANIDNFHYHSGAGGVLLKLWDMGSSLPTSGVTALSDGTQYTTIGDQGVNGDLVTEVELNLRGVKSFYQINEFMAGTAKERSDNSPLTVGNYYAITLHYVDTDVYVYGPDSTLGDFYSDGYAFTAPNTSTAITKIGTNNDLKFNIFSTDDVYLIGTQIHIFNRTRDDAKPGDTATYLQGVISVNNEISDYIVTPIQAYNNGDRSLNNRPIIVEDGGKIAMYYQDDPSDDAYKIIFNLLYLYKK